MRNALKSVAQSTNRSLRSIPDPQKDETLTWEATLVALNRLTKYSSSYLGPLAIGNYWKLSQASLVTLHPSLEYWKVDYQGQISCPFISEQIAPLTPEQLQDVQTWVRAFLKECERVIIDFSQILQSKTLSADVAKLISPIE
jgi:ABC-type Zn uptake system ZnuABC Zn-binding protein ZnuA